MKYEQEVEHMSEVEQLAVPFTNTSCYGLAEMINLYVNKGWYLFKLELKYVEKCGVVDAFGIAVFEKEKTIDPSPVD
jgi:hypothetical protein